MAYPEVHYKSMTNVIIRENRLRRKTQKFAFSSEIFFYVFPYETMTFCINTNVIC